MTRKSTPPFCTLNDISLFLILSSIFTTWRLSYINGIIKGYKRSCTPLFVPDESSFMMELMGRRYSDNIFASSIVYLCTLGILYYICMHYNATVTHPGILLILQLIIASTVLYVFVLHAQYAKRIVIARHNVESKGLGIILEKCISSKQFTEADWIVIIANAGYAIGCLLGALMILIGILGFGSIVTGTSSNLNFGHGLLFALFIIAGCTVSWSFNHLTIDNAELLGYYYKTLAATNSEKTFEEVLTEVLALFQQAAVRAEGTAEQIHAFRSAYCYIIQFLDSKKIAYEIKRPLLLSFSAPIITRKYGDFAIYIRRAEDQLLSKATKAEHASMQAHLDAMYAFTSSQSIFERCDRLVKNRHERLLKPAREVANTILQHPVYALIALFVVLTVWDAIFHTQLLKAIIELFNAIKDIALLPASAVG